MTKTFILILSIFTLNLPISAQDIIHISDDISVVRLADEVYLYKAVAEIEGYGAVSSNGVIVVGGKEAALLDTPVNDRQIEILAKWTESYLGAHITMFVPNHWHSDCMGGLNYLKSTGVRSYAGDLTIEAARREGKPVPDIGFADSLSLDLNGRTIQCYYLGGGHTIDNIVVWLGKEKILFGGCMIKDASAISTGNTSDAVPDEWPATLERIMQKFPDARIVIPGHGKEGGLELIKHTEELLEHVSQR